MRAATVSLLVLTSHVDDLAIGGKQSWLDSTHDSFVKRFKKVTRQQMPFTHCGCMYEKTTQGFKIQQTDFLERTRPSEVPKKGDDERLSPEETTNFRSIPGALLWLTSTRLDIIADVSSLQSKVTTAQVRDIKKANEILTRALEDKHLHLRFRRFETSHQRIMVVHDASSASQGRHYAQEGVLVLMADDKFFGYEQPYEVACTDAQAALHGGVALFLISYGAKERVAYSTSHGETLAIVGGVEAATLCMVRLAELMLPGEPALSQLIKVQENGHDKLPIDDYGDCNHVFELVTGMRTLPQDKTQRLYILSLRETRLSGRMRQLCLVPTQSMTADPLTKSMVSEPVLWDHPIPQ